MRAFLKDRQGGVSVIAAAFCAALIALCALAIDLGYVFLQSRKLQGAADLAAMAAVSDLPRAEAAATATALDNGFAPGLGVQVERGVYVADPKTPPRERFQAGGAAPNAARVTLTSQADLFFGHVIIGQKAVPIRRTATATRPELASFSIGSRLASLNGGLANSLLSGLAGGEVSLSVMDYNALAAADVDLLTFSEALATEANATVASFDDALDLDVTTPQALRALARALDDSGDVAAANAAREVANAADGGRKLTLSKVLDLGPLGAQDHVSGARVSASAQGLMDAILTLAGEGRQVKLDLGGSLPGVAYVDLWLAIGERPNQAPWLTVTNSGETIVRTNQMRLYLEAKTSALGLAVIKLPVLVEAASAEAKLSSVNCQTRDVTLDVKPSVGSAKIGEIDLARLNDFKSPLAVGPAKLVSQPFIKATGRAEVLLGGVTWQQARFTAADVAAKKIKTVSTRDLTHGLIASLVSDLDLDVEVLGLGLGVGPITGALAGALQVIAPPLDGLLNTLSDLTGVRLGEADLQVLGTRCGAPALVA